MTAPNAAMRWIVMCRGIATAYAQFTGLDIMHRCQEQGTTAIATLTNFIQL